MNQDIVVDNLDAFLDCVIDSLYNEEKIQTFEFDSNLNLRIKLHGELWDGHIDYVIAKLVIDIQGAIIKNYNKITCNNIKIKDLHSVENNLLLRVSIDRGCSELIAFFSDILKAIFTDGKMESKDKASICIALILACSSSYVASKYIDMTTEKGKAIQDEKTKEKFIEITKDALKANKQSVNYMYNLALGIGENDSIEAHDQILSKHEALAEFKQSKKKDIIPSFTHYIDGEYYVKSLNYDADENFIRLTSKSSNELEKIHVDALTKFLTIEDKQHLYDMCKTADISNQNPYLSLQVTIEVKGEKIQTAIISGIGEKRSGAITINEALTRSVVKTQGISQGYLLNTKK